MKIFSSGMENIKVIIYVQDLEINQFEIQKAEPLTYLHIDNGFDAAFPSKQKRVSQQKRAFAKIMLCTYLRVAKFSPNFTKIA